MLSAGVRHPGVDSASGAANGQRATGSGQRAGAARSCTASTEGTDVAGQNPQNAKLKIPGCDVLVSLSPGTKFLILCYLFPEMAKVPVSFIIDNTAVPALSENIGVSKKTEHFRRWQQFLRYLVTHGYAYVHIVRTFEELANALTKIENRHAYITFRKIAMNIP